ncbi:MAG: RNA polymerase sigma factor [Cocleimonas sp.]|nr:RNA polymerase sigma factor [Cocleimonas sp.]
MSLFLIELEHSIPALRRYAYSLVYKQEDADDLVQDCLERAIKKQSLWQQGTSLRAWLFTMQHNLYINQLKKRSRQPPMSAEIEPLKHSLEPHKSAILIHDIDVCLRQLPDDQRQVLLLITVEGFAYKEAAKIMDIPLGTVMSRLSRARKSLQALMNGETIHSRPVLRRIK